MDDLLQIAPPSGVCEKEIKLEFNEENEEFKQPELLNLNSILESNEIPVLLLSRTISLDANKEFEYDSLEYNTESPTKHVTEEIY